MYSWTLPQHALSSALPKRFEVEKITNKLHIFLKKLNKLHGMRHLAQNLTSTVVELWIN